jgi:glucose/arabinose dehydrogenase
VGAGSPTPAATQAPAATSTGAAPTPTRLPTATAAPPTPTAAEPTAISEATPTAEPAAEATAEATAEPGGLAFEDFDFELVAEGFRRPLLATHAGDGSGRLFVVEQVGTIRIVQDSQVLAEPFLDLTGQVSLGYEQGLLGLAFSPDYGENGMFFVSYTDLEGNSHVDRCLVAEDDPNRAEECSTVLVQEQPYPNHNGGHIAFGPDGYLYVGLGDGGAADDPQENAQNQSTLLGKILRLEVNGDEAPYTVPPNNPFAGTGQARWEIWAWGLRNPWRFSFDRQTGDLWIGDVGQNAFEEVNFQPAGSAGGENYGWDYFEGTHWHEDEPPADLALVPPAAEYPRDLGACAVTGGYVYRGQALPQAVGAYFFADFCSGQIWTLVPAAEGQWQMAAFTDTDFAISSFGEDEAGELYVVHHGGALYRLIGK